MKTKVHYDQNMFSHVYESEEWINQMVEKGYYLFCIASLPNSDGGSDWLVTMQKTEFPDGTILDGTAS